MQVQAVRNKIASDLHDDVGSALSSLIIYSDVLAKKMERGEKGEGVIQKIRETSSQSVESMRDIVWSLNTRNDDFETMVQHMRRTAQDLLDPADITLQFEYDIPTAKTILTPDKRKNIFLILKEAVNNARKYSNTERLEVSIRFEPHALILSITDFGKGFDRSQITGGNGLVNMQRRADQINAELKVRSRVGEGAQIQLRVPI